jgi:hypothetical protein
MIGFHPGNAICSCAGCRPELLVVLNAIQFLSGEQQRMGKITPLGGGGGGDEPV